MNILLITYDLNKEADSDGYKGIIAYIKEHAWAKLSESSYAIKTMNSPATVYKALSAFTDDNDNMLVLTLTAPYQGYHRKDVIEWLEANL